MNEHPIDSENRFFRLPVQFDQKLLNADLATSRLFNWTQHFNQADFAGKWSSIALRSLSGAETDIRALSGTYASTTLLDQCAYFQAILSQFHCPLESVRLMALAPGSIIHPHRDGDTSYECGYFRLHIPIQTGEKVAFVVDDVALPMKAGECWYANFDLMHSVRNEGDTERVHLVIDCRRNDWSDTLFDKAGYSFVTEKQAATYPPEVLQQIIAELERQDTDTARQLIKQLSGQ
ncbi:hypothetical protein GCM10028807_10340 [Spirosoma daeguense]